MKTKTTIITALLLLAMVSGAVAQEKWEYAVVKFLSTNVLHPGILVSISGKEFQRIDIKKDQLKEAADCTPVLNYVQSMADEGWRVINSYNAVNDVMVFVLERKKK